MGAARVLSDRIAGLAERVQVHRWYVGQQRAAQHLLTTYGDVVAGGPFSGMRYPVPPEHDLCLGAKLLGHYEAELHTVVEGLAAGPWDTIVDVGCAGGYYTTGFALRCPGAQVYGYDLNAALQEQARASAAVNGVGERVHIGSECTHAELRRLCGPRTLLILDVEGAEDELADPAAVPELAATTMLIEVHDFARAQVSSRLLARFASTHREHVIYASAGNGASLPEAAAVPRNVRRWVLDEARPAGMRWFVFSPTS